MHGSGPPPTCPSGGRQAATKPPTSASRTKRRDTEGSFPRAPRRSRLRGRTGEVPGALSRRCRATDKWCSAEGAGLPKRGKPIGVVAEHLAQHLVGVLAHGRRLVGQRNLAVDEL